jgi:hypothetical protein
MKVRQAMLDTMEKSAADPKTLNTLFIMVPMSEFL